MYKLDNLGTRMSAKAFPQMDALTSSKRTSSPYALKGGGEDNPVREAKDKPISLGSANRLLT